MTVKINTKMHITDSYNASLCFHDRQDLKCNKQFDHLIIDVKLKNVKELDKIIKILGKMKIKNKELKA